MSPRSKNRTDPMGQPLPDADKNTRGRAFDVTDPDPRTVIPYDLPEHDPRIQSIFDAMETRRAPPPVDRPFSDGDLAASYATSAPAPARNPTPEPRPAVVVDATPPPQAAVAPLLRTTQRLPLIARAPRDVPPAPRDGSPPRLPIDGRMYLVVGLVGGCLSTCIVFAALSVLRGQPASSKPAATSVASASRMGEKATGSASAATSSPLPPPPAVSTSAATAPPAVSTTSPQTATMPVRTAPPSAPKRATSPRSSAPSLPNHTIVTTDDIVTTEP